MAEYQGVARVVDQADIEARAVGNPEARRLPHPDLPDDLCCVVTRFEDDDVRADFRAVDAKQLNLGCVDHPDCDTGNEACLDAHEFGAEVENPAENILG